MSYRIGDIVYIIRCPSEHQMDKAYNYTKILKHEIVDIVSCLDEGYHFYFLEALILKFKDSIDNNRTPSDRVIFDFINIFKNGNIRYHVLKRHVCNLDETFVKINTTYYPMDLVSINEENIKKYYNFVHRCLDMVENIDIYKYIENNFR